MARPGRRRGSVAEAALVARSLLALVTLVAPLASTGVAAAEDDWTLVGTQGVVRVVIVPTDRVRDVEGYRHQIDRLCPPGETCFVNFHTNSTAAEPGLPLPDAIANEVTARYRRSAKVGREILEWNCRLKIEDAPCF